MLVFPFFQSSIAALFYFFIKERNFLSLSLILFFFSRLRERRKKGERDGEKDIEICNFDELNFPMAEICENGHYVNHREQNVGTIFNMSQKLNSADCTEPPHPISFLPRINMYIDERIDSARVAFFSSRGTLHRFDLKKTPIPIRKL